MIVDPLELLAEEGGGNSDGYPTFATGGEDLCEGFRTEPSPRGCESFAVHQRVANTS